MGKCYSIGYNGSETEERCYDGSTLQFALVKASHFASSLWLAERQEEPQRHSNVGRSPKKTSIFKVPKVKGLWEICASPWLKLYIIDMEADIRAQIPNIDPVISEYSVVGFNTYIALFVKSDLVYWPRLGLSQSCFQIVLLRGRRCSQVAPCRGSRDNFGHARISLRKLQPGEWVKSPKLDWQVHHETE